MRSFSGLKALTIKRLVEFDSCTDLIQGTEKLVGLYGYEGYISELFTDLYRGLKGAIKEIEHYRFDWDNLVQSRAVTSHLHEVREFEAVREIEFTVQGLRYYCLRSGNFETLRHLRKLTISDSKITNFYLDDLGLSKPAQMELILKLPSVSKRLNDIIKEFY